jgi:mannose-6-phosphate isomerase-like protein (cupin superfamily)
MLQSVNFDQACQSIHQHWSPKVVGQVNDQYVKVAKLLGSLAWHAHDEEDELFWVVRGSLKIELDGQESVVLSPGEMFVVPKGVRHNPIADDECWIVLIETVTTKHTGDVVTDRTRAIEDQLS